MNFEKKLLECGSLELIGSYVTEHHDIISEEFKTALLEKIKGLFKALNYEVPSFDVLDNTKREILDMHLESFFEKFYGENHRKCTGYVPHLPKTFFDQCKENNIFTVAHLLKYGRNNVLKMRQIGYYVTDKIEDTFNAVGISGFCRIS